MMKLMSLVLVLFAAGVAQADTRCSTSSNGYTFSETRYDYSAARRTVVSECRSHYRTSNIECEQNVRCNNSGYNDPGLGGYPRPIPGYPNYPGFEPGYGLDPWEPGYSRPGSSRPPTVQGQSCYVRQSGEWVEGDRFFSLASEYARRNRTCVIARIATVPYSGRIYNRDGSRVAKDQGGLSNSEVDRILSRYGLRGCERFSCDESRY